MPAPAKINPHLVQILFDYNPTTGELIPKPTTKRAAYRTAKNQWEIGEYRYTVHRLIWAWHNPDNPNPYAVQFLDDNPANTRIENLCAIHTNPRWLDHNKKQRMYMRSDGTLVPLGRAKKQGNSPTLPVDPKERPVFVRASVQRKIDQLEAERIARDVSMDNFEEEVLRDAHLPPPPQTLLRDTKLEAIVNAWGDE